MTTRAKLFRGHLFLSPLLILLILSQFGGVVKDEEVQELFPIILSYLVYVNAFVLLRKCANSHCFKAEKS